MIGIRMQVVTLFLFVSLGMSAAVAQSTPGATNAVVPTLASFSGILTDLDGKPITGVAGVTFSLYKDSEGGVPLWMEVQNVRPDETGHYTVALGATKNEGLPTGLFASGEARWLGVQAEGQAEQPRVLLLSVPYALKAADAETVGGLPPSAFMLAAPSATSNTRNSGTSSAPAYSTSAVPPAGAVTGAGKANYIPLWTSASNIGNSALFQTGSGTTAKIGIGSTAPAYMLDLNYGDELVRGVHNFQKNGDTAHVYVGDNNHSITATFGGGLSFDTWNWHNAIYIDDTYGFVDIANGTAPGDAQLTVQSAWAGYDAVWAFGEDGNANFIGSDGIYTQGGLGGSGNNYWAGNGIFATAGGYPYAPTAWDVNDAGFFQGDVDVAGNVNSENTSIKIDHPLDPANKFLNHSSVESTDMMNLYNGNVVTDSTGSAVVFLPVWFEALNRDFRYQLTVIGQFAQAMVAAKIANHQFVIHTDKPAVEVSWQVTGIRQDAWANAHRVPVEEEKPARDRGRYISPEVFGAPQESGITWNQHSKLMQNRKEARERSLQLPKTTASSANSEEGK